MDSKILTSAQERHSSWCAARVIGVQGEARLRVAGLDLPGAGEALDHLLAGDAGGAHDVVEDQPLDDALRVAEVVALQHVLGRALVPLTDDELDSLVGRLDRSLDVLVDVGAAADVALTADQDAVEVEDDEVEAEVAPEQELGADATAAVVGGLDADAALEDLARDRVLGLDVRVEEDVDLVAR